MSEQLAFPLSSPLASDVIHLNGRCAVHLDGEERVIVVAGLRVHHYSAADAVATTYAMVLLANSGFATQCEVARAFGCSERTVRRDQERYADGGMTALASRSGWRPGRRRVSGRRLRTIARLKAAGRSNCDIAKRLRVTENAIRKLVGPTAQPARQQGLPWGDPPDTDDAPAPAATSPPPSPPAPPPVSAAPPPRAEPPAPAPSLDVDPANRVCDRVLAALGLLDDAAPVFANATAVPGAGVLCALPVLVASGIFRSAATLYGEIGPAFYGLRTTLVTLLFMALWRIKRPEALKEHDPQSLGRVLGLDRAPEVKTVRGKLTRLASYGKATALGAELARLRVAQRGQLMGFLYVDGHVRVYHGQRTIPKTHVARMRLALPATTDYWVNDQAGDPLFVVTAIANAGMTKMLPAIVQQVRQLIGDRRITIVFDRGGWSPKLFQQLLAANFDLLTYRKGKSRRISPGRFVPRSAAIDGHAVKYLLHDQTVRFLKGKLRLRQVTRLTDDGHQTQVITSRTDLDDIEVAYRMFERWRQENFFKYLREEFLLDALTDYQVEPDDPTRTVPNPARRVLDEELRAARLDVATLEQTYGAAAVDNPEGRRPTMRGFKIAHGKLGQRLRAARDHVVELVARRRLVPVRVAIRDVTAAAVVKLATERKHLTNLIKMLAFQAESDLVAFTRQHYARSDDEGRTLLHELFKAAADIDVTPTELRVTLQPLSSPHRTLAVQALCATLSETATVFPGSRLTLRFAIRPRPLIGLAFPGPRPPKPAPAPPPPP